MGRHNTPMTTDQALAMLAYDIADLVERNNGYDGLIPDDKFTQDDLIATLPALLAANGIHLTAAPAPAAPGPYGVAPVEQPHTVHTCNPKKKGQPRPFGRLAPQGECPRCDELHAGATRREAPPAIRYTRERRSGYPTDAERAAHHAPGGPHATRCANTVCTFGDW